MRAAGRFLKRQVYSRPLAVFAAGFLAGILLGEWLNLPAQAALVCAVLVAGEGVALWQRPRLRRQALIVLLLASVPAGAARYGFALKGVPAVKWSRYNVEMVGRIASDPYTNPDTGRVIARFQLETVGGEASSLCVRLYLRGEEEPLSKIAYGQRLSLTGHIWKNDPVTNPYQFDFAAYLRRNGMSAMATARIEDVAVLETRRDIMSAVIDVRHALAGRIEALFPENAALVQALILGDRSGLSEELRSSLKATGTAHLICISGLHVTVLAGLLAAALGLIMNRRRANALAVLLLLPYGLLVGFTPSFLRALCMFAVLSFAPIAGLPSDGITRLGAALLVGLIVRPLSVGDPGFVLSYSATAGILLLTPPLGRLLGVARVDRHIPPHSPPYRAPLWRLLKGILTLLCASAAAQLASLPAVLGFFGSQSAMTLPFNLACVPLCMLGYVLAVAAVLASYVYMSPGMFLAAAADRLFTLLLSITALGTELPASGVHVGRYPVLLVFVHAALILAASELSRLKKWLRSVLPLALVLLAGLAALITFARTWEYRIVFLDAGQADCAVITTRGRTYLIDTGDAYTPAADYLSATCLHLDGVFLSHPHADHAGGMGDVLGAFTPDAVYVPAGWFDQTDVAETVAEGIDLARQRGVPIIELAAGDAVTLSEDVSLTVFNPVEGVAVEKVNDISTLALVEHDGHGALFTGDLEQTGEPEVVPAAEVLKVAHHGAANATSDRFLEACDPRLAVISVGENSFGHPSQDTLDKLSTRGVETRLTRDCGAITLTLRGGEWRVKTYLEAS